MNDPAEPKPKTILFIEDQALHYEQVAAYLRLHGYHCRRVARSEAREIRQIALELQPLAVVVDFVLLSTSQSEVDRMAENYVQHRPATVPPDASVGVEHYGIEAIPILRAACPGTKILVYTQNANCDEISKQTVLYGADAGVPKQRDQEGKLLDHNAQEIAAKVRQMISS